VLLAAASAQYLTPYNTALYPGLVNPLVAGAPLVSTPFAYSKPIEYKPVVEYKTMEYETMKEEKPMEKKEEEKVISYAAVPSVYGQQIVYKRPVITQKLGVPARFHIKNGELEHTSINKREAEPVFPYINNFGSVLPYSSIPYPTYTHAAVSPVAPAVVPSMVYNVPSKIEIEAPAVVKSQLEYLKPKVEENAKTVANDAITSYMYADKGLYKAENPGAVHVAKREAEPINPFYSTYQGLPLATAYTGVPLASAYNKFVYNTHSVVPAVKPVHYINPLKLKTYSNDRVSVENYAAKNQYHAENPGAVHVAKREAEPLTVLPHANAYGFHNTFYSRPIVHTTPFLHTGIRTPLVRPVTTIF